MQKQQAMPNIVLINCDDLGYGDLGCYGSGLNRTPAIDRLAEEGLRLTDFYMASPVCSPSRGGMLTGCYPPRIGFGEFDGEWVLFPGQGVGMSHNETTIAQLLKRKGYATKLVGKWHCGDQPEFMPTRHGFDEYYGLPYSNDMSRRGSRLDNPPLPLLKDERVVEVQPDQRSLTERYVEQATSFIHDHREQPFFLYMAHMHVHLPLYAPQRFVDQSQNGDYGACVECIDWATACIRWQLEQEGLAENTLVIFTSDNGSRAADGASNAPLRGDKGSTWEGGQRVPCIFWWPGKIPAGSVSKNITASMDFLPTIAALCGISTEGLPKIDGVDFGPLLFNPAAPPHRDTFFYYLRDGLEACRVGDWKLHVYKDNYFKSGGPMTGLYNLAEDIGEQNDLYQQRPDKVAELTAVMDACRKDLGDTIQGIEGENVRPIGRVENPKLLAEYDPDHPYIMALYDKEEAG